MLVIFCPLLLLEEDSLLELLSFLLELLLTSSEEDSFLEDFFDEDTSYEIDTFVLEAAWLASFLFPATTKYMEPIMITTTPTIMIVGK